MTTGAAVADPAATRGVGDAAPRHRPRRSASRVAVVAALLVLAVLCIGPLLYMVFGSLRETSGQGWTLENWRHLLVDYPVLPGLKNSAILACGSSLLTVAVSSVAGFAFAKLPFRGSRVVFVLVVVSLTLPLISAVVPQYLNLAHLHLVGSLPATILVYTAFNAAFAVTFFTYYFLSVPDAYIESAVTEGASYVRLFVRIIIPMAVPALVTIGVYDFMLVWNDLLVALLFLPQPDEQTISVVLATINSTHKLNTEVLLAGATLSIVPSLIVFLSLRRYLVLGFSLGVDK